MKKTEKRNFSLLNVGLVIVIAFLVLLNQYQLYKIPYALSGSDSQNTKIAGGSVDAVLASLIPTGTPFYGEEIGVSFDNPVPSLKILDDLDRGQNAITLTGEKLQRYVNIGSKTACEYCCSATTLVFKDGRAACGCSHSAAMRGVAKYLLKNYGEKMSDEEILTEVNKWKAISFPKQTITKALKVQSETGEIDPNIINQIPSQVGGC